MHTILCFQIQTAVIEESSEMKDGYTYSSQSDFSAVAYFIKSGRRAQVKLLLHYVQTSHAELKKEETEIRHYYTLPLSSHPSHTHFLCI